MKRNQIAGTILGVVLCSLPSPGLAQSAGTDPASPASSAVLRGQVQQFQVIINRNLQTLLNHPFAMLQDAKGIYLPRFGVVFHMELNLAPLRTLSPFDLRPYTDQELRQARDTKLERIRALKNQLSGLLQAQGAELSAVPPDQNIAVVVHLFNLPSERTDGLPTQIVIEVSSGVLADTSVRMASAEEFRKKVAFFDF